MKEIEVFKPEEEDEISIEDMDLDGSDDRYCIDDFKIKTLDEAIIKAYEEHGECVIRWNRKNSYPGGYDYIVNEEEYLRVKSKK